MTEQPTESVTVATPAVPPEVTVGRKVHAGQYRVAQVVPVIVVAPLTAA